jgi:hypothetical protein
VSHRGSALELGAIGLMKMRPAPHPPDMRLIGFVGLAAAAVGAQFVLGSGSARASCRVKNDTTYTFTVASGNVGNQRVGAHATTTIAPGKVQGRSEEGKTIGGACKDGGDLIIREKNGVPLLMPAAAPKKKKKGVKPAGSSSSAVARSWTEQV